MEQPFSLEKNLEEIRRTVETMQKGVGDFDQQIELFTRGTELIQACRDYLDQAELKVKQLIDGKFEEMGG